MGLAALSCRPVALPTPTGPRGLGEAGPGRSEPCGSRFLLLSEWCSAQSHWQRVRALVCLSPAPVSELSLPRESGNRGLSFRLGLKLENELVSTHVTRRVWRTDQCVCPYSRSSAVLGGTHTLVRKHPCAEGPEQEEAGRLGGGGPGPRTRLAGEQTEGLAGRQFIEIGSHWERNVRERSLETTSF